MRNVSAAFSLVRRHIKLATGLIVGLIAGGAGVAFATIPDAGGVIHACYDTSKGNVRIIDSPSQACASKETAVSWNQTGPQGPAGSGGFVSNMVGANISNASLVYADLRGRDLHGASLNGAIINGTDFTGANLSGATIGGGSGAGSQGVITPTAIGTVFQNADLSNSFISGGVSIDANFNGANFTNAHLNSKIFGTSDIFSLSNSTFQNANFHNATIATTDDSPGDMPQLFGGNFQGAILDGTTISMIFVGSGFHGVDFRPALLQPSSALRGSRLASVNFSGLTLTGITILGGDAGPSVVTGANFSGSHFVNANVSGTDFSAATLTGATWAGTICPDGTNSDDNGNTCLGHLVP